MLQPSCDTGFVQEAALECGIIAAVLPGLLESNVAVEDVVMGQPNLADAPGGMYTPQPVSRTALLGTRALGDMRRRSGPELLQHL
jgi:hypothetical protein